MALDPGLSGSAKPAPAMAFLHCTRSSTSRCPGAGALQDGHSSPSGLQVPVLFRSSGSHLYGTSAATHSGLCLCSVACTRGGHLALRLSFNCARVWCLDVARSNCDGELGPTKHGRSALLLCSPCFLQVLSDVVRCGFKRAGRCSGTVSL